MDERRVERVVTDVEVVCQVRGKSHRLQVYDLSTEGCMLAAPEASLVDGESLVLDFLDGITVPARIAWQRENCLGAEFEKDLQPVVVRHLGYKVPNERAFQFISRDRFGRPLGRLSIRPNDLA